MQAQKYLNKIEWGVDNTKRLQQAVEDVDITVEEAIMRIKKFEKNCRNCGNRWINNECENCRISTNSNWTPKGGNE